MQILKLFGLSKKWVILWLVANWLPLMIIGLGSKYQPQRERLMEGDAEGPGADGQAAQGPIPLNVSVPETNEGLSIHLKERVVTDFGKEHRLLKDVAMNIPPKSLVLLLGGSGAGKTTLINAVIGYEQADAKILLNGVDVYEDYDSVKHKIGFVPQKNLIRGNDTVINTVGDAAEMRLPISVSKEKREQIIKEDMDLLGLTSGQDGLVSKKSGGQLRRICIAMELVTDPALFILDEPDSGLDGVISREIFTKLRQIADDGRIVIVITHTPDRVIDLFDKVIVLAKDSDKTGRLAFYGTPQEAKEFFGKQTMEQIVMSVNSKEEGGEGRADELVEKYMALASSQKGGQAS
jgi:ABC-type multidrug transport system ATPase subunit